MPNRTALLIQNTESVDRSIAEFASSASDLEALSQTLGNPSAGGYQVELLVNQGLQTLREELARLFRAQQPDDVVLLAYFGQGLLDQFGEIYLAASDTKLEVLDATGLRLGYLRDQLDRSQSSAKVVLLDCPMTAVYPGGRDLLDTSSGILEALAGNRQGRALLTSTDLVEGSVTPDGVAGQASPKLFGELLVEGLSTGGADLDADGVVTPGELHEYLYRETSNREPSAATPSKFVSSNAVDIHLAHNPTHQPTDLPNELQNALTSPMEWMREGAIGELERLLTGDNRGLSRAAHEALSSLAGDKTPSISRTATSILQEYQRSKAGSRAAAPETAAPGGGLAARIPFWGWIGGGVLVLFALGFVAGMAGLFGGGSASAEPTPPAVESQAPPPASEEPEPTQAPEAGQPEQLTAEPELPLPSSIGMVPVNGGTYTIGANQVSEVENFWIDRFEVSNAAYAAFVESTGAASPSYWMADDVPNQLGDHPVRGLTWSAAQAYCEWVNKRLPTEIEWEVTARGPHGFAYPWGNQAAAVRLPSSGTYPVGAYPANRSPFGAYDMAANVWEWVDQPYLPTAEDERVLRGGANNFPNDMLERLIGDPSSSATIADAGFRCAADQVQIQIDSSLLLTDEFADIQSGWFQARAPVQEYFYGYHPTDFYHVQVSAPEDCLAVRHELELDDFVAEVEIYQAATGTEDGDYRHGLMLREGAGDYYAFLVSPRSQTWRAIKSSPAGIAVLDQGADETINGFTQDTRDRITAIANGAELSFFVNGRLVTQLYDDDYRSGNLGFIVQTLDETYAHIHYDRVVVRRLPRNALVVEQIPPGAATNSNVSEPACGGSVTGDDLLESFFTYTVREGDTLSAIANFFGLSLVDLKGANGRRIEDANVIVVGQTLVIPQQ